MQDELTLFRKMQGIGMRSILFSSLTRNGYTFTR